MRYREWPYARGCTVFDADSHDGHPFGRLGQSLDGRSETTLDGFYAGNFASLFNLPATAGAHTHV